MIVPMQVTREGAGQLRVLDLTRPSPEAVRWLVQVNAKAHANSQDLYELLSTEFGVDFVLEALPQARPLLLYRLTFLPRRRGSVSQEWTYIFFRQLCMP
jgi:hypothetical protein